MSALNIFLGVIGTPEIILIVVVVVLLFGGKKIPELMKGLGNGIKEFKTASREDQPAEKKEENKL
ncbi:twin-arginine translocase TatA/TatE family subunit [Flavobacterium sp. '19STA2R22 D10 B1']|uniref:twin-arginine translocase TatA/TatE family subunit n=1 Tax=Flavobacterium aerium TaxID=3037261 RepID=UPI00278C06B6|nr:twin-arginine translocase TatA/TatE family subunit [Flavobacterium sp. '19STA2R22 D10 B1']